MSNCCLRLTQMAPRCAVFIFSLSLLTACGSGGGQSSSDAATLVSESTSADQTLVVSNPETSVETSTESEGVPEAGILPETEATPDVVVVTAPDVAASVPTDQIDQIATPSDSVVVVTSPVTTITAPVTTVTAPVAAVTAPVATVTTPVATVTAPVATVTAPVATVAEPITTITPPVAAVTSPLDGAAAADDLFASSGDSSPDNSEAGGLFDDLEIPASNDELVVSAPVADDSATTDPYYFDELAQFAAEEQAAADDAVNALFATSAVTTEAPLALSANVQLSTSREVRWRQPDERVDGTDISLQELKAYEIWIARGDAELRRVAVVTPSRQYYSLRQLPAGYYRLALVAVDYQGLKSDLSAVSVRQLR